MNDSELLLVIYVYSNNILRKSYIYKNIYLELYYKWNIFC